MNTFTNLFEELSRLYEEDELNAEVESTEEIETSESVTEAADELDALKETDDEEVEIEIEDDEIEAEDEEDEAPAAKQLILECANCGGIIIKVEDEVDVDEESGVANKEEACNYCNETSGYKVLGELNSYDTTVEESVDKKKALKELFGFGKKKDAKTAKGASKGATKQSKVTFTVYDENGTKQFEETFTEIPGKMSAPEQFRVAFQDSTSTYNAYNRSSNKRDWTYERVSNPASPLDSKKGRRTFVSELGV